MADIKNSVNTVSEFFNGLIRKNCWSIIAGAGTGSMVSLAFGEKIRRQRPLRNLTLSPEQREFDGEFVVFVKDSAWRIVDDNQIICTSDDSNEADGPMLSGLQRLVGRSIIAASITNDFGGLNLDFNKGLSIQLSGIDCVDDMDSYSLFYMGSTIADVGGKKK